MDERPKIIPLFGGCKTYRDYCVVEAVKRLHRQLQTDRVYPWQVVAWLPERVAVDERTIRRDMVRLTEIGVLERRGYRSGYCAMSAQHAA